METYKGAKILEGGKELRHGYGTLGIVSQKGELHFEGFFNKGAFLFGIGYLVQKEQKLISIFYGTFLKSGESFSLFGPGVRKELKEGVVTIYEATFENNRLHGFGRIVQGDRQLDAQWEDGREVQKLTRITKEVLSREVQSVLPNVLKLYNGSCCAAWRANFETNVAIIRDDDVGITKEIVSLKDVLSMARIINPVRGVRCRHKQCFERESFQNLKTRSFACPLCKAPIFDFKELIPDDMFSKLLKENPAADVAEYSAPIVFSFAPEILASMNSPLQGTDMNVFSQKILENQASHSQLTNGRTNTNVPRNPNQLIQFQNMSPAPAPGMGLQFNPQPNLAIPPLNLLQHQPMNVVSQSGLSQNPVYNVNSQYGPQQNLRLSQNNYPPYSFPGTGLPPPPLNQNPSPHFPIHQPQLHQPQPQQPQGSRLIQQPQYNVSPNYAPNQMLQPRSLLVPSPNLVPQPQPQQQQQIPTNPFTARATSTLQTNQIIPPHINSPVQNRIPITLSSSGPSPLELSTSNPRLPNLPIILSASPPTQVPQTKAPTPEPSVKEHKPPTQKSTPEIPFICIDDAESQENMQPTPEPQIDQTDGGQKETQNETQNQIPDFNDLDTESEDHNEGLQDMSNSIETPQRSQRSQHNYQQQILLLERQNKENEIKIKEMEILIGDQNEMINLLKAKSSDSEKVLSKYKRLKKMYKVQSERMEIVQKDNNDLREKTLFLSSSSLVSKLKPTTKVTVQQRTLMSGSSRLSVSATPTITPSIPSPPRVIPSSIPSLMPSISSGDTVYPPSPDNEEAIVILFSGFDSDTQKSLTAQAEALGAKVPNTKEWVEDCTHMVCAKLNLHTTKATIARLCGRWIVTSNWITESVSKGYFVEEKKYGNRLERNSIAGQKFFISQILREKETQTLPALLPLLKTYGKGIVVDQPQAADFLVLSDRETKVGDGVIMSWDRFRSVAIGMEDLPSKLKRKGDDLDGTTTKKRKKLLIKKENENIKL